LCTTVLSATRSTSSLGPLARNGRKHTVTRKIRSISARIGISVGTSLSGRNEGMAVLVLCAQLLNPTIATPPRKLRRFIRYLAKTLMVKDSARRGAGLATRGGIKKDTKGARL
jgi:hypothetical protein